MPTTAGQDIQTPIDPTGFASLDGATLLQLLSGLIFADDVGGVLTTTDAAGNPTVPDAATTTKWQRYVWRRVGAASVGLYVWNPVAASDATYLRWQSTNVSGISAGSIVNSMIADNTITDAKIASVDWSKVINQPAFIQLSDAATGDLTGSTYASLTIAAASINAAKLANGSVTVDKLATDAIETIKIKDQNVTTGKVADSAITSVKMAEAAREDLHQYAAGVFAAGVYSVTLNPAATAYTAGMVIRFKADTLNTGATDINVNALGVKNLFKSVTAELVAGDIPLNSLVTAVYDGTNFQMYAAFGVGSSSGTVAIPAAAGLAQIAHGLGSAPFLYKVVLSCVGNDAGTGWLIGDEIALETIVTGGPSPLFAVYVDATNINLRRSNLAGIYVLHKTTGVQTIVTAEANFVVKAYSVI